MKLTDANLREWLDSLSMCARLFVSHAMTLFSDESHILEIETGSMRTMIRESKPSNPAAALTVCMLGAVAAFSAMVNDERSDDAVLCDEAGQAAFGPAEWHELKKRAIVESFAACLDIFSDETGTKTIITKVEKSE